MARPASKRPRVTSDYLRDTLEEFLNFRHRFRHAYGFELRWNKMEPLVQGAEETFNRLKVEINFFLESVRSETE